MISRYDTINPFRGYLRKDEFPLVLNLRASRLGLEIPKLLEWVEKQQIFLNIADNILRGDLWMNQRKNMIG